MASLKTEGTELSLGFGLLDVNPRDVALEQLPTLFEGTLPAAKYEAFQAEYQANPGLYQAFVEGGRRLRQSHELFNHLTHLRWTGMTRQAATTSAAVDLLAANTPISVKNESNVVLNGSPFNVFVSMPTGQSAASRTDNWYQYTDSAGIQALYGFVSQRLAAIRPIHATFAEFDAHAAKPVRKEVQQLISELADPDRVEFIRLYTSMCHRVADVSAEVFNRNVAEAMRSTRSVSIIENIVEHCFRINSTSYILAGMDKGHFYALVIPDITGWKRAWRVNHIQATPDAESGQSVVNVVLEIGARAAGAINRRYEFHVEIRWSHGKFCGSPEAKLYKNFPWSDVPFFRVIVEPQ